MDIKIYNSINNAYLARGLTVVIDVFRAFTTACYVIENGAKRIIPVGEISVAYQLKKENPDYILMGERDGCIQEGFDYGNSPALIQDIVFSGKTVIHTTSLGTQGIANTKSAEEVLAGSFVNAGAIISYIKFKKPDVVSLIPTGSFNEHLLDEDQLCARYIKNALEGNQDDLGKIKEHLRNSAHARAFFDDKKESHPVEDFELCMALDKFDFVLKAEPHKGNLASLIRAKIK